MVATAAARVAFILRPTDCSFLTFFEEPPALGRVPAKFAPKTQSDGQAIFWTALSERRGGLQLGGAAKPETTYLAMNLFLLLAVAVPLSCCLGFLSLLAFLGVMILGAIIHVVGIARAARPQWRRVEPANNSAG